MIGANDTSALLQSKPQLELDNRLARITDLHAPGIVDLDLPQGNHTRHQRNLPGAIYSCLFDH